MNGWWWAHGRRRRQPLRCLYCGRPAITWPRSFTDEFHEEHKCPSGRGHAYSDDPYAARLIVADAATWDHHPRPEEAA